MLSSTVAERGNRPLKRHTGAPRLCSVAIAAVVLLAAVVSSPVQGASVAPTGAGGSPDSASVQLIHLQVGSFDPLTQGVPAPPALAPPGAVAADDYYIVQFRGTVLPEYRADLETLGGKLYGYVADHAYLVKLAKPAVRQVRQLPEVRWVGHYDPGYRVSPALFDWLESNDELVLVVSTFEPDEADAAAQAVWTEGGEVHDHGVGPRTVLRALLRGRSLSRLAQVKGIAWIEEYVPYELFNDEATAVLHADDIWSSPGLTGTGQTVAIADTGLDVGVNDATAIHPDFRDSAGTATRIVGTEALGRPPLWDDPDSHGTHVAGSVLGNGTQSSGLYAGVAPGASLYFQSVLDYGGGLGGLPSDLGTLFGSAYAAGARVHTNSWGADQNGAYTTSSLSVDQYAWNHKDLTILFAAGNAGTDASPSDGVVDPGSIGSPGTAKNCITVGASENNRPSQILTWYQAWPYDFPNLPISTDTMANNTGGMAAFSSRGPTKDGRIKPDLVAPGTWISSTRTGARSYDIGFESGVLSDDWHNPPAGPGWEVSAAGAHTGSYGLANGTPAASYASGLTSFIYTPYLDYRTGGSPSELSIWMNYDLRSSDFIRVYIVGSGLQYYEDFTGDTGGGWVEETFTIYASQLANPQSVFAVLELVTAAGPVPSGYYCLWDDLTWPANGTLWGVVDDDYLYAGGTSMARPP